MPAKVQWLLRLPEIEAELERMRVPVLDRAAVENLFRLRRRQAITLMHGLGGYQAGRTFLVERERVLEHVRAILGSSEFECEARRRQRLGEELETMRREHRAADVRIPVSLDTLSRKVRDLPDGIQLRPGRLEVNFAGTEDLLTKLFEIAQAASNDFDRFEAMTSNS